MTGPGATRLAARALAIEAQAAVVIRALQGAGIDALLLKGPSIERWLYGPGERRIAADVDLLVAPRSFAPAERCLQGAGFANRYDGASPDWADEHADVWRSDQWPAPVDLHRRLWGIGAAPEHAWDRLWAGRTSLPVCGAEVAILGEVERALALALHVAQHGDEAARPLHDLERAVARLPAGTWSAVATLARDLDAEPGLAAGLAAAPEARELLAGLGLHPGGAWPQDEALWTLPQTGVALVRIRRAEGWRAKAALLWSELLPSSGFMRTRAAYGPLARRGRLGLACAHVVRWAHLAREIPAGVREARRHG